MSDFADFERKNPPSADDMRLLHDPDETRHDTGDVMPPSASPPLPSGDTSLRDWLHAFMQRELPAFTEYALTGRNVRFFAERHTALPAPLLHDLPDAVRAAVRALDKPAQVFLRQYNALRTPPGGTAPAPEVVSFMLRAHRQGVNNATVDEQAFGHAQRLAEVLQATLTLAGQCVPDGAFRAWDEYVKTTEGQLRAAHARDITAADVPGHPAQVAFSLLSEAGVRKEWLARSALSGTLAAGVKKQRLRLKTVHGWAASEARYSSRDGFARTMEALYLPLSQLLNAVEAEAESVRPALLAGAKMKAAAPLPDRGAAREVWKEVRAWGKSAADSVQAVLFNTTARAAQRLPSVLQAVQARDTRAEILRTGASLLNEIQQLGADIGQINRAGIALAALTAWRGRAESVPQGSGLDMPLQAEKESGRQEEKEARAALEQAVKAASGVRAAVLLSPLYGLLKENGDPAGRAAADELHAVADSLDEVWRSLAATADEAEDIKNGDERVAARVKGWHDQLAVHKSEVKRCVATAIGASLNSFSRSGMLTRMIAERAEADKARWLNATGGTSPDAAARYDRVFETVMTDYVPALGLKTGREEELLAWLPLALKNAAAGRVLYPESMADIRAGARSLGTAMLDWGRRGVVRRLLRAVCGAGYTLIPGLASLPVRAVIRLALASLQVAIAARRGRRGVRGGEGGAGPEIADYAGHVYKTAGIKIAAGVVPAMREVAGLVVTLTDLYREGGSAVLKQRLGVAARELPWTGAARGTAALAHRVMKTASREEVSQEEVAKLLRAVDAEISASPDVAGTRAGSELERIAASSSEPELAGLARRLADKLGDSDIHIDILKPEDPGDSHYDLGTRRIMLSQNAPDSVILHEIAHSLSAHQLRAGLDNPDTPLGRTVTALDDLRTRALESYRTRYGGKDQATLHSLNGLDEFVAGLYAGSSDFTRFLAGIDGEGRSLLAQAAELLSLLLGLETAHRSALERAIGLSGAIMGTPLAAGEGNDEGRLYYASGRARTRRAAGQQQNGSSDTSPLLMNLPKILREKRLFQRYRADENDIFYGFSPGELPEYTSASKTTENSDINYSDVDKAQHDFLAKQKKYDAYSFDHDIDDNYEERLNRLKARRDRAFTKLNEYIRLARAGSALPPAIPGYVSSFIVNELKLDPKREVIVTLKSGLSRSIRYPLEQVLSPGFRSWLLYSSEDQVDSVSVDWGWPDPAGAEKIFSGYHVLPIRDKSYRKLSYDPSLKPVKVFIPPVSSDAASLDRLTQTLEEETDKLEERSMSQFLKKGRVDTRTQFSVLQIKNFSACISLLNDKDTLDKIIAHASKGDYSDIYFCNTLAREVLKEKAGKGYKQWQSRMASVIYYIINNKDGGDVNINNVYNDFLAASKERNPFYKNMNNKKMDGYFSVEDFKSTDEVSAKEYYDQYYDYRDKYSQYDSALLTAGALAQLNLTADELLEAPRSVKTFALFGKEDIKNKKKFGGPNSDTINQETMPSVRVPGGIILTQLSSERWVLTGNLLGTLKSKVLSREQGNEVNSLFFKIKRMETGSVWEGEGKRFESNINDRFIGSEVLSLLYNDETKAAILKGLGIADNHFRFGPWDPAYSGAKQSSDDNYNVSKIDENSSAVSVLHQSLNLTNLSWAKTVHIAADKNSPLWDLLPFYRPIYGARYDREHVYDTGEIMLDFLSFAPLLGLGKAVKIGKGIATALRTGLMKGLKQSLKGRELFSYAIKYALKEANKTGALAEGSGIVLKALWDTVEPLPVRSPAKGLYRRVRGRPNKNKATKLLSDSAGLRGTSAGMSDSPSPFLYGSRAAARTFKLGQTEMLGEINKGSLLISLDGGATWKEGNKTHMLAFALQNAGGKPIHPEAVGKQSTPPQPTGPATDQKLASSSPDAETEFVKKAMDPNLSYPKLDETRSRSGQIEGDDSGKPALTETEEGLLFSIEPQQGSSGTAGAQSEPSSSGHSRREHNNTVLNPNDNFRKPFGPDSYIRMGPDNKTVIIRAHGFPGSTNYSPAKDIAPKILSYLQSRGIDPGYINHIELRSCYGATMWSFSQGQALANILQIKVDAYRGGFSDKIAGHRERMSSFEPYHNPVAISVSELGNDAVYHVSKAVLAIRRRLRIGRPSTAQEGTTNNYSLTSADRNTRQSAGSHTKKRRGRTAIPDGFNVMSLGRQATTNTDIFTGTNARGQSKPVFSGHALTDTKPFTDAYGQAFIHIMQNNLPPHSKARAAVLIGGTLILGGAGIYGWKLDHDVNEEQFANVPEGAENNLNANDAKNVLKNTEDNFSDLKKLIDSGDTNANAELQTIMQHYFGDEKLDSKDIEELIVFIRKVRTTASNVELKQLASGSLPESFVNDVPAVFTRLSPQWIIGFYSHIFDENEVDGDTSTLSEDQSHT